MSVKHIMRDGACWTILGFALAIPGIPLLLWGIVHGLIAITAVLDGIERVFIR